MLATNSKLKEIDRHSQETASQLKEIGRHSQETASQLQEVGFLCLEIDFQF